MFIFFKYFRWFLLLLLITLSSCSKPSYTQQKSALIVIKSTTLKYADMGFIYQGKNETKVEVYASGHAALSLTIHKNSICMDKLKCLAPKSFNQKFLNSHYPKGFLSNIFNQKPIFSSSNLKKRANGFQQTIKNSYVDIEYSVLNNSLLFRDRVNGILIKIKEQ